MRTLERRLDKLENQLLENAGLPYGLSVGERIQRILVIAEYAHRRAGRLEDFREVELQEELARYFAELWQGEQRNVRYCPK